ncbi:MAG: glutaredoxin 2 [Bdellovibrionota bacterium]
MGLVLYHYVHCPYCVRVRMALGFLNLSYESRVVPYDDQKTPVDLIGVKMLPILAFDRVPMKESLDIIRKLDGKDLLKNSSDISSAESFTKSVNNAVHSLAMPHWIHTQEFTPTSRDYFLKQKEAKRGPFKDLIAKAPVFIEELKPLFENLTGQLNPFFQSDEMRIQDIMIAAHLWGLYVVPEFQFPDEIHQYLQNVKKKCRFNYHQDYWS